MEGWTPGQSTNQRIMKSGDRDGHESMHFPRVIQAEIEHLKQVLSNSGYTCSAWDVATTVRSHRPQTSHSKDNTNSPKESVTLTYVGHTTEQLLEESARQG